MFLIKNFNLLILVQATGEKSSFLKREHLALQNMNFLHFCWSFWPSWIRIPNADADSDSADPCGSGSTTLVSLLTVILYIFPFPDFMLRFVLVCNRYGVLGVQCA
jgi:hypothetical protein